MQCFSKAANIKTQSKNQKSKNANEDEKLNMIGYRSN